MTKEKEELKKLLYELAEPKDLAHKSVGGRILTEVDRLIDLSLASYKTGLTERIEKLKVEGLEARKSLRTSIGKNWKKSKKRFTGALTALDHILSIINTTDEK